MTQRNQLIGSSPYDVWLINNHPLTQQLPLKDELTNRLVVNWYLPNDPEPNVRLTRLINVAIDETGIIMIQDTIDRGFGKYVELSAEFEPDGTLIKSPEYHEDKFFLELVDGVKRINETEGASMSMSFNGAPLSFFDIRDGVWSARQEINKALHIPRDNPKQLG